MGLENLGLGTLNPTLALKNLDSNSDSGPKIRRLTLGLTVQHTDCVLKEDLIEILNSSTKRCTTMYERNFKPARTVHWPKPRSTRLNVPSRSSACPELEERETPNLTSQPRLQGNDYSLLTAIGPLQGFTDP